MPVFLSDFVFWLTCVRGQSTNWTLWNKWCWNKYKFGSFSILLRYPCWSHHHTDVQTDTAWVCRSTRMCQMEKLVLHCFWYCQSELILYITHCIVPHLSCQSQQIHATLFWNNRLERNLGMFSCTGIIKWILLRTLTGFDFSFGQTNRRRLTMISALYTLCILTVT